MRESVCAKRVGNERVTTAEKEMSKRLFELRKLSAQLFDQVWNPTSVRTGNKILSKRLLGPIVDSYYPASLITPQQISRAFPGLALRDRKEVVRMEDLERRRRRGKGAPKKGKFSLGSNGNEGGKGQGKQKTMKKSK